MCLNFFPEVKPAILRMQNLHCSLGHWSSLLSFENQDLDSIQKKKLALGLDLEVSKSKIFSTPWLFDLLCQVFICLSCWCRPCCPRIQISPTFSTKDCKYLMLFLGFSSKKVVSPNNLSSVILSVASQSMKITLQHYAGAPLGL